MKPEAEKLKELLGKERDVDLAGTLKSHPELTIGLNEYLAWRDQSFAEESRKEEGETFGHSAKNAAKALEKKK